MNDPSLLTMPDRLGQIVARMEKLAACEHEQLDDGLAPHNIRGTDLSREQATPEQASSLAIRTACRTPTTFDSSPGPEGDTLGKA